MLRRATSRVAFQVHSRDGSVDGLEYIGIQYENETIAPERLSNNFNRIFAQLQSSEEVLVISNDMDEMLYQEEQNL